MSWAHGEVETCPILENMTEPDPIEPPTPLCACDVLWHSNDQVAPPRGSTYSLAQP